ncbi:variable surface protein [Plasmodium gonderi]|uniref:Variable surface protein n=1 Tax=Plasmodium gonderi TaxID=77519 RepID=A0A1Y1JRT3_PLAGO|nr:variable surface protein [Plasmodium gonderi]GAW83907.1 variable surface protein [Plasmodium gonderi]
MSDTKSEDEDYDLSFIFNAMFYTCTEGFSWDKSIYRVGNEPNNFTALCSKFFTVQGIQNHRSQEFSSLCRVLGLYLNHIKKRETEINLKSCCELFYYKLKNDITDKFSLHCTYANKDSYKKMTEQRVSNISTTISQICMQYSGDIEEDTSKLLEYLFNIYYYIDLLKNLQKCDTQEIRIFKENIENLEKCPCKNKNRLKAELEKIVNVCEGYIKNWNLHPIATHAADHLTHDSWIETRRKKLRGVDEENIRIIEKHPETLKAHTLVADTLRSNYTPYFSFIKTKVRKLRRNLHKNNKNIPEFMYSFDVQYKNSIDDRCKIAYS